MAFKPKEKEVKNALLEALQEINVVNPDTKDNSVMGEIVDIMTFCDHPDYLNLPASNFNLWPVQKIILKTFYIHSRGNENLTLTTEEWEWLYANDKDEERDGFIYEKSVKDVIKKLLKQEKEKFTFTELHLCIGRRGSKTIIASIISAYEAYKLLKIGNGNPHRFYNIPEDEDIAIINVALSQSQSGRLFSQIQARLRNSVFFKSRIAKETTTEIRLFTDKDLIKKGEGATIEVHGSVVIVCGHSNPDTLRGYSAILILFDELAFYDESGKVTGSAFYNALEPSTRKFKKFGDGRLVEISSPSTMVGIFYDIFKNAKTSDHILSYQLPTWCLNADITYESLQEAQKRNPESFPVEYGAQWAKYGIYGNYFEPAMIDRCVRYDIGPHTRPMPRVNYYIHVDPAQSGPRYVAVMVAKEYYTNHIGKRRCRVILANVWVWDPTPGLGLMFCDIDRQMIDICARFHPMAVSYDQFNSVQSLQLLKSHGIHTICTAYNRNFKNKIYQNLKDMMSYQPQAELFLYEDPKLIMEMKALKYRPTMRGISLVVDKHGEVKTDDVIDALAGATAMASENIVQTALPLPTTVNMERAWGRY